MASGVTSVMTARRSRQTPSSSAAARPTVGNPMTATHDPAVDGPAATANASEVAAVPVLDHDLRDRGLVQLTVDDDGGWTLAGEPADAIACVAGGDEQQAVDLLGEQQDLAVHVQGFQVEIGMK